MTFSPNHELEPTAMSPRLRGLLLGAVAQLDRSAASSLGWVGVRPTASRAVRGAVPQRWVCSRPAAVGRGCATGPCRRCSRARCWPAFLGVGAGVRSQRAWRRVAGE